MKDTIKMPKEIKELYVGIDVHKSIWVLSIYDGIKFLKKSLRILPDRSHLLKVLSKYKCSRDRVHLVYEAGCFGSWLCYFLRGHGYDCIITPPTLIPTQSGNKVKTDKRDSQKLALYLSKELLKGIHLMDKHHLIDRELTRTRKQLVRQRCNFERMVKSKLLCHGIDLPWDHRGQWSEHLVKVIRVVIKGSGLEIVIESLLESRGTICKQIKLLDKEIKELATNKVYREISDQLESVPGIGRLTAMTIVLELGVDWRRFKNVSHLCSFLGLTPAEYSSGPYVHRGRITRAGNVHVRNALIESSWMLMNKDKKLKLQYDEIKKRRGSKRAIVAIARRLAIRVRAIVLKGEKYKIAA